MKKGKKPVALITGIAGFAGSWLAEELIKHDYQVIGAIAPGESLENLATVRSKIELFRLDITSAAQCTKKIAQAKPDHILHLAAFASVARSFGSERAVFDVNLTGTLNLLHAAAQTKNLKRFMFVSSPDCYGLFSPKARTLTESDFLAPVSPYGISKAAAEQTCRYFHRAHGLPVVIARAFNHTGPRQTPNFVVPSFARQIAHVEAGRQTPKLKVGNLSARRDLSDVRDVVRGYRLLIERGQPGEIYQLCSGRALAIDGVLKNLLKLSRRKIAISTAPEHLRPVDLPILRGSNHKAVKELGYQVRYKMKTTLTDTLDYWRGKVGLTSKRA